MSVIYNAADYEYGSRFPEDVTEIVNIGVWDPSRQKHYVDSLFQLFRHYPNLEIIRGFESWNTDRITSMRNMFVGCKSLKNISGVERWNVSNVLDMQSMFSGCHALTDVSPLASWKTHHVFYMSNMFRMCKSLTEFKLPWFTNNVCDLTDVFYGCDKLCCRNAITVPESWATNESYTGPTSDPLILLNFDLKCQSHHMH